MQSWPASSSSTSTKALGAKLRVEHGALRAVRGPLSNELRDPLWFRRPPAAPALRASARRAAATAHASVAALRRAAPAGPRPASPVGILPKVEPADPAAMMRVIVPLVYELLDAHWDTAVLAGPLSSDPHWRLHLAYVRELQRVSREVLARVS